MGGLISIRQAAQRPDTVAGLVLVDPALPPALRARPDPKVFATFAAFMVPVVGRRMVRRPRDEESAVEAARELMQLCCADPDRIPPEIVDLHAELAGQRLEYPDVDSEMLTAAQSLLWVLADRKRYAAMLQDIDVPVLLLHGDQDRLINIASARAAAAGEPALAVRGRRRRRPRPPARGAAVDHRRHPGLARRAPGRRRPRLAGQDLGAAATVSGAAAQLARRRVPPARERPAADARRLAAGLRRSGPPTYDELTAHVESCLDGLPRHRQRVQRMPLDLARPVLGRRPPLPAGLPPAAHRDPAPGGDDELRTLFGRVLSQRLDLDRPLWEIWLVEGLEGGRWALITKTHHAMIDGLAGNELMEVLLDRDPAPPARVRPRGARARRRRDSGSRHPVWPGIARLPVDAARALGGAARRGLASPGALARAGAVRAYGLASVGRRAVGAHQRAQRTARAAPAVGLGPGRPRRRQAGQVGRRLLGQRRRARRRRRWLPRVPARPRRGRRGRPPSARWCRCRCAPRSTAGSSATTSPRCSPTCRSASPDPRERLAVVAHQMTELKGSGQAVGVESMLAAADFVPATLMTLGARGLRVRRPARRQHGDDEHPRAAAPALPARAAGCSSCSPTSPSPRRCGSASASCPTTGT